ncbi:MAG: hypothetical protein N3F62_01515 [Bacteroidia bacterium]|nr:hypothetical protein [Bacteroidia bacterium]
MIVPLISLRFIRNDDKARITEAIAKPKQPDLNTHSRLKFLNDTVCRFETME